MGVASLISRASLARLAQENGDHDIDWRRFRMLIEIDGVDAHEEDTWLGRATRIGGAVITWGGNVGRCLTTSRDPDTGEIDLPTLDMLRSYRGEIEDHRAAAVRHLWGGRRGGRDPGRRHGGVAVSEDRVRIDVADHVATVTLTRADKHNALDRPMFEAIIGAAERLSGEPGVRAVVLHGEGPSFCSGLDLASLVSSDAGIDAIVAPLREDPPNWFQRTAYDWLRLPVPVIAAVHGNCFGGGLQIALAADIRIATPDARLSVMEVKWGLIPDMSITRTLPAAGRNRRGQGADVHRPA